ncbi:MAG: hypothetical protein MK207_12485 [Saprospiraceae bacterium]|nr:hypothetical protein [Saprospiraceae bacterium]
MAFKIVQKIKPAQIQDKTLDPAFLKKYYKQLQQLLIKKTDPENPTGYFFCVDFFGDDNLLIMGKQTPAYLKIFRAAGKGKDGFDKKKVSIGNCFILDENGKKILCLMPNPSLAKGKKQLILKSLKKLRKSSMKKIMDIRWLTAPLEIEDEQEEETTANAASDNKKEKVQKSGTTASGEGTEYLVTEDEIVKRTKELQKGIEKLKKDVLPRYKNKETSSNDADFVKALRKAGHLFISKLMMTDPNVSKKFSTQKKQLENGIPQWEKLEEKIKSQKTRSETSDSIKKELQGAVKRMNNTRNEIKELLKRVNLKGLS